MRIKDDNAYFLRLKKSLNLCKKTLSNIREELVGFSLKDGADKKNYCFSSMHGNMKIPDLSEISALTDLAVKEKYSFIEALYNEFITPVDRCDLFSVTDSLTLLITDINIFNYSVHQGLSCMRKAAKRDTSDKFVKTFLSVIDNLKKCIDYLHTALEGVFVRSKRRNSLFSQRKIYGLLLSARVDIKNDIISVGDREATIRCYITNTVEKDFHTVCRDITAVASAVERAILNAE